MPPRTSTFGPWATPEMLPADLPVDVTDQTKLDALQMSTDVLFGFTGRQWPGVGTEILFPPSNWCGEGPPWKLELPWAPIVAVTAVTIDGAVVDPAGYRLDSERFLVRLRDPDTGERTFWPVYQDETARPGDQWTWSTEFTHGLMPAIGGVRSSVSLAAELAKAWTPSAADTCRLPKGIVQSLNRQGVAVALSDPTSVFSEGRTGLRDVDLWIGSIRTGQRTRPGSVIDVAGMARKIRPRFRH